MAESTLDQVQRLVDQLTPLEQVRLLEYLAPRIARVVAGSGPTGSISTLASVEAWAEFLRVGDALAASDPGEGHTLTEAVLEMRR